MSNKKKNPKNTKKCHRKKSIKTPKKLTFVRQKFAKKSPSEKKEKIHAS